MCRRVLAKLGPQPRVSSPPVFASILMIVAPKSPNNCVAVGPARMRLRSRTKMSPSAVGVSEEASNSGIIGTFFNNSCNHCKLLCLLRSLQRNPQFVAGVDSMTISPKCVAHSGKIVPCEVDAIVGQLPSTLLQCEEASTKTTKIVFRLNSLAVVSSPATIKKPASPQKLTTVR